MTTGGERHDRANADYAKFSHQLRGQVRGTVLSAGDSGYEGARRGWNLALDQYPALILVAQDAADVQAAVDFAHDHMLGIAIQSTGHGVLRAADDSLLIITSLMNAVQIDPQRQTAYVQAGALWRKVLEAAQEVRLAPLLGSSPYVGVVGYTLGGGMGWLARRYGLAADSVNFIDIVTADGQLRRVSATDNSDLFWGLRGGGGNFGVVVGLEIRLYPVTNIFGGMLMYPIDLAAAALRLYRTWVSQAPDELTSSMTLMNYPNLPQIPEPVRGKGMVLLEAAYTGLSAQGEALIQPWREWRTPLVDTFRTMPFRDVGTISNDPVDPLPGYGTGELLHTLTDEAIDVIVQHAAAPIIYTELRHGGGAIARVAPDANAISNRDAQFYLRLGGVIPTPEIKHALEQQVAGFKQALRPHVTGGMYLNFMSELENDHRTSDAYTRAGYRRLAALKAKYDLDNLFHFSFAIPTRAE